MKTGGAFPLCSLWLISYVYPEAAMPILLVIDDEQSVRYSFRRIFNDGKTEVLTAATAAEGLELLRQRDPDVVVLDLQLPDRNGLDVFRDIHGLDPKRPVIFITAHGTTETAIEAMKAGAFDYLVKPVDLEQLSQVIERAFEAARLMHEAAVLPVEEAGDRIVGRSSGHAGDVQDDRAYRSRRTSTCSSWAKAAPARNWSPAPSTTTAAAPTSLSWRSTAPPFPKLSWKASCSATSRAPSPALNAGASASSSSATAARSSSTKSAT